MTSGTLISFEGLDGAGKTTQMNLLSRWLDERSIPVLCTREPGGTLLGGEIRRLLFQHSELTITPLAEAFLFLADRAQHFSTLVLPALEAGKIVLSDRCFDSSIAYQGGARGVDASLVEHLSLLAMQQRIPDLTIFLDLDPALVRQRTASENDCTGQREEQSRFDLETEDFHTALRRAFLRLAERYPRRIKRVDASQEPLLVHKEILMLVSSLLS